MNNAIVIYDNLKTEDTEFKQRIIDITNFYTYAPHGFKLFKSDSITQKLIELSDLNFQWAIINILGHCVDQISVFEEVIEKCKTLNSPLMAHIVHHPNSYPCISDQFVVVDLQKWKEVGCPAFEESIVHETIHTPQIERSVENFHDDYTPYWLKPLQETRTISFSYRPFGSKVIQMFIENGYTITNFDDEIRSKKWNLYAKPNYDKLVPFFKNGEIVYEKGKVPQILERIITEKESLKNTVYILNSESITKRDNVRPIDHYIGVASGFKGLLILNEYGFTNSTTVTYIDVSSAGLDYQRYLINRWDGDIDNYLKVVYEYQKEHQEYRYAWRSWNSWESEINLFLSEANITKEQFKELWDRYKNLKHNFLIIDLLQDTSELVSIINKDKKFSYIWVSNAFKMQWNIFLLGKKHSEEKLNDMLDQLKNTGSKILVEQCNNFVQLNWDS